MACYSRFSLQGLKKTAILMFAVVLFFTAQAQDKYEFAVVYDYTSMIAVQKHSVEYIQLPKGSDRIGELIKKVEEMSKEGWEIYNSIPTFTQIGFVQGHVYYLKRKLKE